MLVRRLFWLLAVGAVVACSRPAAMTTPAVSEAPREAGPTLRGGTAIPASDAQRAAPLTGGQAWLNTGVPLSLERLRGHVVVLDFWTYCCVNCLHVLPELARVESDFADQPVVVVGVHSGKFDAERDVERIRSAMARHDVTHPVVVDAEYAVWKRYDVHAWPTVVVIDSQGRVRAKESGEPLSGALSEFVGELLGEGRRDGTLATERLSLGPQTARDMGALAFPGQVAVGDDGTIAVVDSSHHRVVLADNEGRVQDVVGSGIAGSADGPFEQSAFRRPQGAAFAAGGRRLYVADTENHQVRLVDLESRRVQTVAGTGRKGGRRRGGLATQVALRSPWDVALRGETVYVAMAGAHQIWALQDGRIEPLAGTGREMLADGPFEEAAFSQPSGLSLSGSKLYVADAEASAVRVLDLEQRHVKTLVGRGLFEFGDIDGVGDAVRLQHPLDVVATPEGVYVADSYNDKLKLLHPNSRRVQTLTRGTELLEPSGIARLADGGILIADTNHHQLRRWDPEEQALSLFPLDGLTVPLRGLVLTDTGVANRSEVPVRRVRGSGQLGPGSGVLVLDLLPPPGGKLTAGAPLRVEGRGNGLTFPERIARPLDLTMMPVRLPVVVSDNASGPAQIDVSYVYCTSVETSVCRPERVELLIDLELSGTTSGGEVRVRYQAIE